MALISSKLWEENGQIFFECPGCDMPHSVNIDKSKRGPCWEFNHNMNAPTFSPSIIVQWGYGSPPKKRRCHSFVRDGKIQFLNDCTHDLAGQTVEIPQWDNNW